MMLVAFNSKGDFTRFASAAAKDIPATDEPGLARSGVLTAPVFIVWSTAAPVPGKVAVFTGEMAQEMYEKYLQETES